MDPCPTRGILACSVALVLLPLMQPMQRLAQASDVINDADAYAVYAAVVRLRFSSADDALAQIALLQETRAVMMCPRDETLPPQWHSVVDSYRRENARVRILQPGFDLGLPYSLVPLAALRALMQEAGYDLSKFSGEQSPGAEVFARYPGGRLFALSAVGFNVERTRAMVTFQFNCFPSLEPGTEHAPCYQGEQVIMEKQEGRWVRAKVAACGWIA